jgi:hypothetical protein
MGSLKIIIKILISALSPRKHCSINKKGGKDIEHYQRETHEKMP